MLKTKDLKTLAFKLSAVGFILLINVKMPIIIIEISNRCKGKVVAMITEVAKENI